jgi:hypothetical protein
VGAVAAMFDVDRAANMFPATPDIAPVERSEVGRAVAAD